MASQIAIVEAPGPNVADPSRLPFKKLAPGKRLLPNTLKMPH
jgi:microcystin degradation protein MlrC